MKKTSSKIFSSRSPADSLPGIFIFSRNNKLLYANPEAKRILLLLTGPRTRSPKLRKLEEVVISPKKILALCKLNKTPLKQKKKMSNFGAKKYTVRAISLKPYKEEETPNILVLIE